MYTYDDKHYSLIGENRKKVYKIGDIVKVKLVRADVATRQIDFVLVEDEAGKNTESDNIDVFIPQRTDDKRKPARVKPKKPDKTKDRAKAKKRKRK